MDFYTTKNFLDNPANTIKIFKNSKFVKPNFYRTSGINSGLRAICEDANLCRELKIKISDILNKNISHIQITFNINSAHSVFGCPHRDDRYSMHAGVIYLNENAPENTGTTLYETFEEPENYLAKMQILYCLDLPPNNIIKQQIKEEISSKKEKAKVITKFENSFNKLVLYNAKIMHSGDNYFGYTKNDSRMTIAFFVRY